MKYRLFLVLMAFYFQVGNGQTLELKESKAVDMDRFVGFDNYQNLYFLKDRVLHKQGKDGNFVFNALQLGRISSVDIINPLKVVVFFEDTNTVVLLDNKLSEIERISFNYLNNFFNAGTATTAGNNSLWIFNLDSQQLEMYNYKTKSQTIVSQPFPGKVKSQASNFNYCFILTEGKIRAFNVYGSFLNETPSEGYERIVQQNENLVAVKDNQLYYYKDFARHKSKTSEGPVHLEIPETEIRNVQLLDEVLYIYDGKQLYTYKLNLPKKE